MLYTFHVIILTLFVNTFHFINLYYYFNTCVIYLIYVCDLISNRALKCSVMGIVRFITAFLLSSVLQLS